MSSLRIDSFDVMIGDVLEKTTDARGGQTLRAPRRGANWVAERRAHFSGNPRINRPDRGDESLEP
jgi:hypothetical protein